MIRAVYSTRNIDETRNAYRGDREEREKKKKNNMSSVSSENSSQAPNSQMRWVTYDFEIWQTKQ